MALIPGTARAGTFWGRHLDLWERSLKLQNVLHYVTKQTRRAKPPEWQFKIKGDGEFWHDAEVYVNGASVGCVESLVYEIRVDQPMRVTMTLVGDIDVDIEGGGDLQVVTKRPDYRG